MKRISLHLRSLCLALGLASVLVSPGCATLASDLTAFRSAVDVADMVIDAIDDFANSYFTAHPNPADQAKIEAASAQARAAAAAALAIANGAGDASNGNVAQAFQDFETAYSSLLALAQSLGVRVAALGAKVGVQAAPGVLTVPGPADLRPAMVKEVARPVVSLLSSPVESTPPAGTALSEVDGNLTVAAGGLWTMQMTGDLVTTIAPPNVPMLAVDADLSRPHECDPGSHSVVVVAPGAVCLRDGATWEEAIQRVAEICRSSIDHCTFDAGNPIVGAILDMARPFINDGRIGIKVSLGDCDTKCGGKLRGLPIDHGSSCLCWGGHHWTRDQDVCL